MDENNLLSRFQESLAALTSKSHNLSRLMCEYEIDIVVIQKSHTISDLNLQNRGKLLNRGIVTYVRDTLADCFLTHLECSYNIHVIAVEVSGVTVMNVYKPPSSNWSSNTLKVFPHPTIYVGDFNSHNQLWGYLQNNADGNRLLEWMTLNKIHLIQGQRNVSFGQMEERLFSRPFNDNSRS
jgi:hypothetical protein